MILAAVDCADGKGAPPVELEYAWNAHAFGGLPESGGQLDQPAGLLMRMRAAENYYNAWQAWKRIKGGDIPKFKENNPQAWEIVKRVQKMRRDG